MRPPKGGSTSGRMSDSSAPLRRTPAFACVFRFCFLLRRLAAMGFPPSVARDPCGHPSLDVDVCIVRDVEHHLDQFPAGELELRLVVGAYRVPAVVTDAQALAAERVVSALRAELSFRHRLLIDVQFHRPEDL